MCLDATHIIQSWVPQVGVIWRPCSELPTKYCAGETTVINGKVFYGGRYTNLYNKIDEYTVYCYDSLQDKWTTLPPLPVKWFGLGQISGNLVAVGGKQTDFTPMNQVYTYNERLQTWQATIPPMPTARFCPGVTSLQSALLVVAGGNERFSKSAVEIFKPDISQWYRTDPLPTVCEDISLVTIGNTCYALGGFCNLYLDQALYASVDDLLCNAVPANQTTHSGSSDTQSVWKTLPNTPTYGPAAAALAGNLLAIGGRETPEGGAVKKEVYLYSPSTNSWIYIGDLPAPRCSTAVAVLSWTEVLVIGGLVEDADDYANTAYMGTLTFTA